MTVRPQAILFDLDGTLIDSNPLHVRAWDEAFREAGHAIPPDAILDQIGKGGDKLVPALLPDLSAKQQKAIADRHGDIFTGRYLKDAHPFPEAGALLHRAHVEGSKVVLATSAAKSELDHYVELLGVGDILAGSASEADASASKPNPGIFAAALGKVGIAADRALMVGDSVWDIEGAKKAGIATVALLAGGVAWNKLEEAGARAIYADAAALLADYAHSPLAGTSVR